MIFTISNERASISTHKKYFRRIVSDFSKGFEGVYIFRMSKLIQLIMPNET